MTQPPFDRGPMTCARQIRPRTASYLVSVLLALAPLLSAPATGRAHEAHGGHTEPKALNAGSAVSIAGYQVQIMSDSPPLAVGRESRLIARIFRESPPLAPATGGRVRIGVAGHHGPADPEPAPEVTWAGHYAVTFTPSRAGTHHVRVLIDELEARRFEPPLTLDVPAAVERAPGLAWPAWAALAVTAMIGAVAVYGMRLHADRSAGGALNLLEIRWVRRLSTSRAFVPALQVPALVATIAIVVLGVIDVQDGGRNLATKLTWTIWWAGVIFTFVLAGRVWCVACPFGALNEWTSRLAAATRRLPRIFRNIWWATALFILLTWLDEQLGVVRSPGVTAWLIVAFAAMAILVGLRYERRSFCRHLCPIGGVIGLYSMVAPVELRARDAATCRSHRDKQCYHGASDARGCPMFEFPQALDRNNYCTMCLECVRGCSRDNLVVRFRTFGADLWGATRRALDESYLAVALVGLTLLVTAEMLAAWPEMISWAAGWLPAFVRAGLKPVTYLGLVETVVLLAGSLVVGPLLVLAASAVSLRLAGRHTPGLRRTFVVFGYMFVPIGLAVHLAHNLAHLLLEGGGLWPAFQRTVAEFTPWSLGEPDWHPVALAPEPVVSVLQIAVLIGFFGVSLLAGHRLARRLHPEPRAATRALVPFAVLAFAFTAAGIVLLSLPMGARHGM